MYDCVNEIQDAIFVAYHEDAEVRDAISYIAHHEGVDLEVAFDLLKNEIDYLLSSENICLFRSDTHSFESCQMLDKRMLEQMTLEETEFKESGPFYFFSVCDAA